ncbi:hypothetical protein DKX38_006679 [Salix brachista]|uniref:Uncharacterized protein n=1 Tax=Salix brachista TaxID=2182728 RepID=A0A5N5N3F5_9ROSI|nr:hypothetical protein DKX38_006679 [Salix brachista]
MSLRQVDWECYECILHSPSGNHSTALHFNNFNAWIRKPTRNSDQGSDELVLITRKRSQELRASPSDANNTQCFSLSLSSNRQSKLNDTQFAEAYESECLESKNGFSKQPHHDSKVSRASYLCPLPIPSILTSTRTRELLKRLGGEAMPPRLSDTVNETNTGDEASGDNDLGAQISSILNLLRNANFDRFLSADTLVDDKRMRSGISFCHQ